MKWCQALQPRYGYVDVACRIIEDRPCRDSRILIDFIEIDWLNAITDIVRLACTLVNGAY